MSSGRSTVDELSYAPDEDEKRRNEEQQAATGRKSWKTLRDKEGEAVWSPALEAALIEGLRKYVPPTPSVNSRRIHISKRGGGRFPMRNRIISDYIYNTTGKYRTPKQVGSRLQQLRDTCRLKEIRLLIAPPSDDESDPDVYSGSSPSISPPSVRLQSLYGDMDSAQTQRKKQQSPNKVPKQLPSVAHANIFVTVNLESDASNAMLRSPIALAGFQKEAPLYTIINLVPLPLDCCPGCADLSSFDSTVQFWSPFPVHTETVFSVSIETLSQPIHSELATMLPTAAPPGRTGWFYTTNLCPQFWNMLSHEPNIKQYRVLQCITPQWSPGIRDASPINICYRFRQIPPATPNLFAEAHKWQRSSHHQQFGTQQSRYSSLAGWSGQQPQEDVKPPVGSRISGPPVREDALKFQDGITHANNFLAQPALHYDYLVS
ncbi:hypothetical protein BDZ89DRAFT_1128906 [Hymenopellis radicata]|nr:hypothetical protein BDZ89DRAFT_1128906 [Hymenopellis radicata]